MEFALTVVLFFPLLLPVESIQVTYHIRPTWESPCPYQDCLTLSEYATETSRYTNSNNLTLLFLPGEHVLSTPIEFHFLDRLSLLGDQLSLPDITSKITCTDKVGFIVVHTSFIEIKALSISKCGGQLQRRTGYPHLLQEFFPLGRRVHLYFNVLPAFAALFVQTFYLDKCHFNSSYLPLMLNKSTVCIRDSTFSDSNGNFGGAVAAYNSTVELFGRNIFRNNQAVVGGGVFAINSSLVSVGQTSYLNNTAKYGGGICAIASEIYIGINFSNISTSSYTVSTYSSDFFHNHAQLGGGLQLVSSILIQTSGWLIFTQNSADSGGAVGSHQSHISLNGFAMFERNSAAGLGGAVSARNGSWSSAVIRFVGNSARTGGAVYAADSTLNLGLSPPSNESPKLTPHRRSIDSDYSIFINNSATANGGGIAAERCIIMILRDTSEPAIDTNSTHVSFIGNKALKSGGGLFIYNLSTLSISGMGTYVDNIAGEFGGVITAQGKCTFALDGENTFTGNQAQCGGGIALIGHNQRCRHTTTITSTSTGSSALLSGNISLLINGAMINGGGVYLSQSTAQIYGNVTYVGNTAGSSGGGMFLYNSSTSAWLSGEISLSNNGAENNGGGVYLSQSTAQILGNITCVGNTAGNSGGGVFLYNSCTLNISGTGIYVDNIAGNFGGVIGAELNNTVALHGENTFTENQARCGGGIAITGRQYSWIRCSQLCSSTGTDSRAIFSGDITLVSNGAELDGGGVHLSQSTAQMFGNITCVGNTAGDSGGGMHLCGSILSTSGNELYINNASIQFKGGEIKGDHSHVDYKGKLTFINNRARTGGGGIVLNAGSTLNVTGNESFVGNSVQQGYGGAIYVDGNSHLMLEGESLFTRNYAGKGGGIAIKGSTGLLLGKASFISNKATLDGGGINLDKPFIGSMATLTICGTGTYINNTAGRSGGVIAVAPGIVLLDSKSENTFFANVATRGAAVSAVYYSVVLILGTLNSSSNRATTGGVIYLDLSSLNVTGNATYFNNKAIGSGGVIFGIQYSKITLSGRNTMVKNCAGRHGGAIAMISCRIQINSEAKDEGVPWILKEFECKGNEVNYSGGALYARESHVELSGVTTFINNVAKVGGYGGGLHAVSTNILMNGLHEFVNNSASYGGGMAIESYVSGGFLIISRNSTLSFLKNCAHEHGGAAFVTDLAEYTCPPGEFISEKPCFIKFGTPDGLPHVRLPHGRYRNITKYLGHVVFEGNLANDGGAAIFGGIMYDCRVSFRSEEYPECREQTCYMSGIETVAALTHSSVKVLTEDPLNFMSDTYTLCVCNSKKPNCIQTTSNYTIYPGETISVPVTVVGKQGLIAAPVASVIHARISESHRVWLDRRQDTQSINDSCSGLDYTLFARNITSAKLTLSLEGPCQRSGLPHYIYLSIAKCPFGFYSQLRSCVCERRLQRYTNSCDINTKAITRKGDFWVGFDHRSRGLILHPHCSFDYCKLETVSFTLNSTDLQCAHGRSGTLCGACKSGYSLKLGSSQCSSCSNVFLLLFIPFAIAGFLLVVFLFICKVTVAAGTTSGLIFYANVLAVNKSVFFAAGEINILTVFIAWLNLDLGIETCFIDGMDMYTRTWLQFAFPLYIWLLVGIIALVSHHSTFFARIIGPTNPVSVLATLFLLSYTKLLRTIIATLSFTTLDYPDDRSVTVWVYDGNIEYFKDKHIPLFLAGLLAFLLLFLPYTLLLFFGQWIEAGSSYKLLAWANKPIIKYFLDAYHAPFNKRHRYWTGLLLFVRFLLFITSAIVDIDTPRDPTVNLLVLGTVCVVLMILVWNSGSMYKKWHNSFLESSFILNLAILALASYHVKVEGGNQTAVVYTSVSIAFVTFLGIITYHVVELLRVSRFWRANIAPKLEILKKIIMHRNNQHDAIEMTTPPTALPQPVPTTFVELREPLLEPQH